MIILSEVIGTYTPKGASYFRQVARVEQQLLPEPIFYFSQCNPSQQRLAKPEQTLATRINGWVDWRYLAPILWLQNS